MKVKSVLKVAKYENLECTMLPNMKIWWQIWKFRVYQLPNKKSCWQIWKFRDVLFAKYEIVGKFENLEFTSYMTIQSLSLAEYEN